MVDAVLGFAGYRRANALVILEAALDAEMHVVVEGEGELSSRG